MVASVEVQLAGLLLGRTNRDARPDAPVMSKQTYVIKDFALNFLRADQRRTNRTPKPPLAWLGLPTKMDGGGFKTLAKHEHGTMVFGAFVLMAEQAAKTNLGGILANKDGPYSAADLETRTGHPKANFEIALNVLQEKEIGWVTTVDFDSISGCFQIEPDASAHNTAQQNTTQNTTAQPATASVAAVAAAEFSSRGIDEQTASWASGQFPPDRIVNALRAYDEKASAESIRNPAGMLRTLLSKGCTPPKPRETRGYHAAATSKKPAAVLDAIAIVEADNKLRNSR